MRPPAVPGCQCAPQDTTPCEPCIQVGFSVPRFRRVSSDSDLPPMPPLPCLVGTETGPSVTSGVRASDHVPLVPDFSLAAVTQEGRSRVVIERVHCPQCGKKMNIFSKEFEGRDILGWRCSGARTGKSHCYWEVLAETSSVTIIRPQQRERMRLPEGSQR